jgi:hypothetical protein
MRIGFDCDGVLSYTPFGRLAVHAPSPVPDLPPDYESLYELSAPGGPARLAVEYLRFAWRPITPGAASVVRALAVGHELYVVTGRSVAGEPLLRRWLRHHGLAGCFAGLRLAPPGLRPAQHKLAVARILGIDAHIDDDPRTAYHLANNGVERVFLYDHAGAHGDAPLPPHLALVRSLTEFADALNS